MAAEKVVIAFLPLFLIFHQLLMITGMPMMVRLEAPEECSFSALLLEGRPEDEHCNLMLLIRRRLNSARMQIDEKMDDHTRRLALDAFNRPNRNSDDIETCPAPDSICKLEGSRLCICPEQHVCEHVGETGVHRCEMLAYFRVG